MITCNVCIWMIEERYTRFNHKLLDGCMSEQMYRRLKRSTEEE